MLKNPAAVPASQVVKQISKNIVARRRGCEASLQRRLCAPRRSERVADRLDCLVVSRAACPDVAKMLWSKNQRDGCNGICAEKIDAAAFYVQTLYRESEQIDRCVHFFFNSAARVAPPPHALSPQHSEQSRVIEKARERPSVRKLVGSGRAEQSY